MWICQNAALSFSNVHTYQLKQLFFLSSNLEYWADFSDVIKSMGCMVDITEVCAHFSRHSMFLQPR